MLIDLIFGDFAIVRQYNTSGHNLYLDHLSRSIIKWLRRLGKPEDTTYIAAPVVIHDMTFLSGVLNLFIKFYYIKY